MIDPLAYAFLFPVGVMVASLGISAGISGSNFWIPIYFLWLGIDPKTSFWLALFTMVFGFGSGIVGNLRNGTINWAVVKEYLKVAVPFAVLGTLLVPFAPVNLLLGLFAGFVILYGGYALYHFGLSYNPETNDDTGTGGERYRSRAAVAGFLHGLIATGLGKITVPCLIRDCRIRTPAEAVGSTVVIVFVVTLCAAVLRLTPDFIADLIGRRDLIVNIMMWVAPGVVVGGQVGPLVAGKLSGRGIRVYVGVLLVFVGILLFLRIFSGP